MNTPSTFGEWLQMRRQAHHLTRAELAQRVGCSVSALRKIEDGERRPSLQVAELLASALDVPAGERLMFVRVARGELTVERLPANAANPAGGRLPRRSARVNLPNPTTPLIGREPELAALTRLLSDPQCRLVTIVGPGGIGKTRLALEAASALRQRFTEGVCFVSLAPLNSAELLVPAIAESLGFAFFGPSDPKAQLLGYLRSTKRHLLIVLDNLEHLLDGAGLLADLLQYAPEVKLLTTSRERLNLRGEWALDLQGLPVPPEGPDAEIGAYSAVALFVQAAQRVRLDFALSEQNWSEVARICRLVGGMPLAIELAAAWTHVLSCGEIALEVEHGLDFLATTQRDVPERHRSLRAVFDHSWQLLSADEQQALRQLSVFQGGFSREAAEEVTGARLSLMSALVTKSLVRRTEAGRYDMHELIRQYAAARLVSDPLEQTSTCDRHSRHYLHWLHIMEVPLKSTRQTAVVGDINAEFENVRAAWQWASAHQMAHNLPEASLTLFWWFETQNRYHEGFRMFQQAAEAFDLPDRTLATQDQEWQITLGVCLAGCEYLGLRGGLPRKSEATLVRSLAMLGAQGTQSEAAFARMILGIYQYGTGHFDEGAAHLKDSQQYYHIHHLTWDYALCTFFLGYFLQLRGQAVEAYNYFADSLAAYRAVGDPTGIARALCFLGFAAMAKGAPQEAEGLAQQALPVSQAIGDRWSEAVALNVLAVVASARRDFAQARSLFQTCLARFQSLSAISRVGAVLNNIGSTELELGDLVAAQAAYRQAIVANSAAQIVPMVLDSVVGLAATLAASAPEQALTLVTVAINHAAVPLQVKSRAEKLHADIEATVALPPAGRPNATTLEAVVAEIVAAS